MAFFKLIVAFWLSVFPYVVRSISWTAETSVSTANGDSVAVKYLVSEGELFLEVSAATTGWVGFGIGEVSSGSMKGADLVVASVNANGKVTVTDMHVGWGRYPLLQSDLYPITDAQQDWVALEGREEGGITTVRMKRALSTGDANDRCITDVAIPVLAAYGLNGEEFVSYHDSRRGTGVINFFGGDVFPSFEDADEVIDLTMGNYTGMGTQVTHYACSAHELDTSTEKSIIGFEVILDPNTEQYIHHMLIHACPESVMAKYDPAVGCFSPTVAECPQMIYGWAVGGRPERLPDDVGFKISGLHRMDVKYVVVEIHYDNPAQDSGIIDNSGIRLHVSNTLRTHVASTLVLGDLPLTLPRLPAETEKVHRESVCPSVCTDRLIPEGESMTVFRSFLHMHSYGRQAYTTLDDKIVDIIHYWDFGFQQGSHVNYEIKAGDQLHTHCVYDTTGTSSPVEFGVASSEEMCQNFLTYYPRIDTFQVCGYLSIDYSGSTLIGTACGGSNGTGDDFYDEIYSICTPTTILSGASECPFKLFTQISDGLSFIPEAEADRVCSGDDDANSILTPAMIAGVSAGAAAAVIIAAVAAMKLKSSRAKILTAEILEVEAPKA